MRPTNLIWLAHFDKHWSTAKICGRLRSHWRSDRKRVISGHSRKRWWREHGWWWQHGHLSRTLRLEGNPQTLRGKAAVNLQTIQALWNFHIVLGQGAHIICFGDKRKFTSVSCQVSVNFKFWDLVPHPLQLHILYSLYNCQFLPRLDTSFIFLPRGGGYRQVTEKLFKGRPDSKFPGDSVWMI